MDPTKEIVNLMKEMENNIKSFIKETIKEALKEQEKVFSSKIDEIFSNLKTHEKQMEDIINSQKFLNSEFEDIKQDVTDLMKLDLEKRLEYSIKEFEDIKIKLNDQEKAKDDLDQYQRRENLEFHGIPATQNEDTNNIIRTMAKN